MSKSSHDVQELVLSLVELHLAAFRVEQALLQADGNSIQVLDLFDHLVGCAPELAEPPLLGQCAVTALLELVFRKVRGYAYSILHAGTRNAAVVLVRHLARRFGEQQAPNVLDAVVAYAERYEVFLSINRNRSDLMVAAYRVGRHRYMRDCDHQSTVTS